MNSAASGLKRGLADGISAKTDSVDGAPGNSETVGSGDAGMNSGGNEGTNSGGKFGSSTGELASKEGDDSVGTVLKAERSRSAPRSAERAGEAGGRGGKAEDISAPWIFSECTGDTGTARGHSRRGVASTMGATGAGSEPKSCTTSGK